MWRENELKSSGEPSNSVMEDNNDVSWWTLGGGFDENKNLIDSELNLVFNHEEILYLGQEEPNPSMVQSTSQQEAKDQILLPLFFEAHSHLFLKGSTLDFAQRKHEQGLPSNELLDIATTRAQALFQYGIGHLRDGGDNANVGLTLSSRNLDRDHAEVASPGSGVNRIKRYGSFFARNLEEFSNPEEVVEDRLSRGADHLKVVVTGIIDFEKGEVKGSPQFDVPTLKPLVDAAHRKGLKVMAHASGEEGVKTAVLGGVDSIEHGFFMSEEILSLMKERGTLWVPTFAPVQVQVDEADLMGWSNISRRNLEAILLQHRNMLKHAKEIGVGILPGSDAGSFGVPHGQGFLKELTLMEEGGLKARDLLDLACFASYKLWFDQEVEWAKGAPSNFQFVSKDALNNTSVLEHKRQVLIKGETQKMRSDLHSTF